MNPNFGPAEQGSIDPGQIAIATSIGLAIIPDTAVDLLTFREMAKPAGVLQLECFKDGLVINPQILISRNALAALHGALDGWSARLPIDLSDQYEALRSEARSIYTARADEALGGAS